MKKISPASFEVSKGEIIEFTVTPVSVGAFVAAAHHGNPLVDQSPTKKHFLFRFKISSSHGQVETTKIVGQFMGTEPSTARYEIQVSSNKGQAFPLSPIRKPSSTGPSSRSRVYTFVVV